MLDPKIFGAVILNIAFLSSISLAQTPSDFLTSGHRKAEFVTSNSLEQNARLPKLTKDSVRKPRLNIPKDGMRLPELDSRKSQHSERQGGVIGTGGGSGIQSSDGRITPLEVLFSQESKPLDGKEMREKFPLAYGYFQEQVSKISKSIPSFAKDIESTFSKLKWTITSLEKYLEIGDAACLNSMGVFKVRSGNRQVVIACQKANGEIILSATAIKLLKKPEYLGVIFLHETFVNKMLLKSYNSYVADEEQMITKVMPYILSNQILDAKILYDHAAEVGFHSFTHYNAYELEVFEDSRFRFEKIQADFAELEREKQAILKALQEFMTSVQVINNCPTFDGTEDIAHYIQKYFGLRNRVANLISRYKSVLNSDARLSYSYKESTIRDQIMIEDAYRDLFKYHDRLMNACIKAAR